MTHSFSLNVPYSTVSKKITAVYKISPSNVRRGGVPKLVQSIGGCRIYAKYCNIVGFSDCLKEALPVNQIVQCVGK